MSGGTYTTSYQAAHASRPSGSSSGVARWRDVQPRPSPQVDQIAKWKAQAIEKERNLAEKRRERATQQHSALPSLGGSDAPDRVASRVSSGMPAHLSYSAQSSAAAPASRLPNAAAREQRRDRATDDRYASTRRRPERGSDLGAAVEARRARRQPATSSAAYGLQAPAPAPAPAPERRSSKSEYMSQQHQSSNGVGATPPRRGYENGRSTTSQRVSVSPAPPPSNSSSSKPAAPVPGRRAVAAAPAPTDSTGKKLCCDACDGPHLTSDCPLYKGKARDKHKDGQKGKPKEIGSGTGGNFVLSKAKEVRMPPDGSCLFHSLCYGLGLSSAPSLRKEIANFIAKNPDLEIAGDPLKDWIAWDGGGTVSSYTRKMANPHGPWGGGIEMAACSRCVPMLPACLPARASWSSGRVFAGWFLFTVRRCNCVAGCIVAMCMCTRSSGCALVLSGYRALTTGGRLRLSMCSTVGAYIIMRSAQQSRRQQGNNEAIAAGETRRDVAKRATVLAKRSNQEAPGGARRR
eukprot:COSAG06_NODE_3997_length_4676_cov_66.958488_2_plen_518_part_00